MLLLHFRKTRNDEHGAEKRHDGVQQLSRQQDKGPLAPSLDAYEI
jgi:hypothetical protein